MTFLRNQTPFWLFTFAVIAILVLSQLIQDGMFVDGLFYTVVSKNMANGLGTFWAPWYSKSGFGGMAGFHEHPPLVFGLQALFFKVIGNGLYTERIYILCTFLVSASLINSIWKKAVTFPQERQAGWLPLLLWATTPLVFWSFSNNMQENTMGVFVLMSVLFFISSQENRKNEFRFLFLAGTCVFLASFSKGVPGLFPLCVPAIWWFTMKRTTARHMIWQSAVLFMEVVLAYSVILLLPGAKECLSTYVFQRMAVRIESYPTVDSHFWIMYRLFIDIAPSLGLVLLLLLIRKLRGKKAAPPDNKRWAAFLLLVGLAGTAPLMLTLVQRGFYFVPAIPFFALGLAVLISRPAAALALAVDERPLKKYLTGAALVLLLGGIIYTGMSAGKMKRDEEMLTDIYIMGPKIESGSIVGVPHEMWNAYSFEAYFLRHYEVSMIEGTIYPYYITPKNSETPIPTGFIKEELPTRTYDLYKKY